MGQYISARGMEEEVGERTEWRREMDNEMRCREKKLDDIF